MAIETKLTIFLNKRKWIIPLLFGFMCFYLVLTITAIEIKGFQNLDMLFGFSIGGELCAIIVAIMLTISILPAYKRQSGYIRIFVTLLTIGCSCCCMDTLQMLVDGVPELAALNKVLSIFVFANEIVFLFFFWLFVTYALNSEGKSTRILTTIASLAFLGFTLLPFVNFFYPIYFTISDAGVYARNASTWWICRIYLVLIAIFVIIAVFLSKAPRKTKIIILAFMFLPFTGLLIARFRYGVSLLYTAMMISLVMIYSFLFSDNEKTLYSTNKELGLATNIQKHMLPSIFPAFPGRKEFDVYALMDPAKEVGGDFYDFFLIDDTHLGLVMADVSDKGVPAALFMMASKIMVQNYALIGYSPKEVLTKVNKQICSNNQDEMFVTVWLGILDLKTGILTASNAGHERPIIKRPDGHFEVVNDKHGFVVGWLAESVYSEYEIKLEKGSKLFVYTDGVPEARDNNGQFGMERTINSLIKYEDLSPEEICKYLLSDVNSFIGSNNQFDDITMLCLEYRGYDEEEYHIIIPANKNDLSPGIQPIVDLLERFGSDHKIVYKVEVAVEEILANIASYAYSTDDGEIDIKYHIEEPTRTLFITVTDSGKPFDPLAKKDPDTTLSSEERSIGGLGIFIVKNTMDDIKYLRKDNKNILIMKKKV